MHCPVSIENPHYPIVFFSINILPQLAEQRKIHRIFKQAGAELGQAQLKLGLGFTLVFFYLIDEQEI